MEDCDCIDVRSKRGVVFQVSTEIFDLTLRNTTIYKTNEYDSVVKNKTVSLSEFRDMYIRARVPYSVVFMSREDIIERVVEYEKIVFSGVDRNRVYSIASNGSISVNKISLMLKHLTLIQKLVARDHPGNDLVGILKKPEYRSKTIEEKAEIARKFLNIEIEEMKDVKGKEKTFLFLERKLGAKNILVSVYDHRACAQVIDVSDFAGVFISHKKTPYIFIRASDDKGGVDPWGRKNLIMAIMLGMLLHGNNQPVLLNTRHDSDINDAAYQFAEEFLMPSWDFPHNSVHSLDDVESLADLYHVSPAATIMRLHRLGIVDSEQKSVLFDECDKKYEKARNKKGGRARYLEKGVILTLGNKATDKILRMGQSGLIDGGRMPQILCPRKGEKLSINGVRRYLNG